MIADTPILTQPRIPELADFSRRDLESMFSDMGVPTVHAKTLYRGAFKQLLADPRAAEPLPRVLQTFLGEKIAVRPPTIARCLISGYDASVKFVFAYADGAQIETVLMPESKRLTVCVSSQVGCRQACSFCHTGRMGLKRNLYAAEIVAQVTAANRWIRANTAWQASLPPETPRTISNVVFMGMGEPLDNIAEVLKALDVMTDEYGLALAWRRISVSTAGHVEGLKRLLAHNENIRLALSLHAANDRVRSALMPINRTWPLAEIRTNLLEHPAVAKNGLFVQYTLMRGINDSDRDAEELVAFLAGINVKVNIIPFNDFNGSRFKGPDPDRLTTFRDIIHAAGLRVMIRYSKGQDIAAACGQLVT